MKRQRFVIFALIAMVVAAPVPAQGFRQQGTEMGKGRMRGSPPDPDACAIGRWRSCDIQQAIDRGLFETGLSPAFPAQAQCRGIDEGYAISYAARRGREQYHGGIDMPAPWGTPMIAAAAGTVVAKYAGENSPRGIEIVLRHSPEDTGIPLWIYTQYAPAPRCRRWKQASACVWAMFFARQEIRGSSPLKQNVSAGPQFILPCSTAPASRTPMFAARSSRLMGIGWTLSPFFGTGFPWTLPR